MATQDRIATALIKYKSHFRTTTTSELGNFTLNTRNIECLRFVLKRVYYCTSQTKEKLSGNVISGHRGKCETW